MSYVKGSEEAILTTQTSSERYFQRPDNHHADVDSTRTSLNRYRRKPRVWKTKRRFCF
jgi:hypothetical protein